MIDVRKDVTCGLLSTKRSVVGVHPCLQACRCHTCDGYNDRNPSTHKSRSYRYRKSRTRRRRLPSSRSLPRFLCDLFKKEDDLGAETFRGKHPTTTIRIVQDISKQAEATFDSELFHKKRGEEAQTAFEPGLNKVRVAYCGCVKSAMSFDTAGEFSVLCCACGCSDRCRSCDCLHGLGPSGTCAV